MNQRNNNRIRKDGRLLPLDTTPVPVYRKLIAGLFIWLVVFVLTSMVGLAAGNLLGWFWLERS